MHNKLEAWSETEYGPDDERRNETMIPLIRSTVSINNR
jgi:hypothetical protein